MTNSESQQAAVDQYKGRLPRHIAIIMDGNNRWATGQGLAGAEGHKAGERAVQAVIKSAAKAGVEVLTLFAFSSENWQRSDDEVTHLMRLFLEALNQKVAELDEKNVSLRFIGDLSAFSSELQEKMHAATALTEGNSGLVVNVAVNYGGQWDITQAAKKVFSDIKAGRLDVEDVAPSHIQGYVEMSDLPLPDLCIRTAGEQRISNFLLWQMAYSELYFAECFWPDFDETELEKALLEFGARQRRYGGREE